MDGGSAERGRRGAASGRAAAQGGQATVEWLGLVLAVALALGAPAGGVRGAAKGESTTGLGEAVAQRITCAARDACAARPGAPPPGDLGSPTRQGGDPPPWQQPPRGVGRGVPPPTARRQPRGAGLGALPAAGRVGAAAKRAWIVCFAYRRWRSEVEHPRTPREAMPVGETLDIVNDCLNPWNFFFG